MNFEKAKRLGTSQSAEMKPRDMLLRYYEKKLKVYAKTSLGVAASRLLAQSVKPEHEAQAL